MSAQHGQRGHDRLGARRQHLDYHSFISNLFFFDLDGPLRSYLSAPSPRRRGGIIYVKEGLVISLHTELCSGAFLSPGPVSGITMLGSWALRPGSGAPLAFPLDRKLRGSYGQAVSWYRCLLARRMHRPQKLYSWDNKTAIAEPCILTELVTPRS